MPSKEPENQGLYRKPFTAEPPITPSEHRQNREFEADADRMAENFAKALNQGVMQGKT
jgi:hypothetical protein